MKITSQLSSRQKCTFNPTLSLCHIRYYKLHVLNQLLSLKFLFLAEKLLQSVQVQIDKQYVDVSEKLPGFPGVISLFIPAPRHRKLTISPFIGTWSLTVGENIFVKGNQY